MAGTSVEFEEKEFEGDANRELALTYNASADVWSPGQKIEELLGFDAAASPHNAPLFARWNAPLPYGVRLSPSFWERLPRQPPASRLPTQLFSLFLQYKRPAYHDNPLDDMWATWREPYYRITYKPPKNQLHVLAEFERAVQPEALVLYVAPAFRSSYELEHHRLAGSVLQNSNVHPPSRGVGHAAWTYVRPGGFGVSNEAGELFEGLPIETLIQERIEASREFRGEPFEVQAAHLASLAGGVREVLGPELPQLRCDKAGVSRDAGCGRKGTVRSRLRSASPRRYGDELVVIPGEAKSRDELAQWPHG